MKEKVIATLSDGERLTRVTESSTTQAGDGGWAEKQQQRRKARGARKRHCKKRGEQRSESHKNRKNWSVGGKCLTMLIGRGPEATNAQKGEHATTHVSGKTCRSGERRRRKKNKIDIWTSAPEGNVVAR